MSVLTRRLRASVLSGLRFIDFFFTASILALLLSLIASACVQKASMTPCPPGEYIHYDPVTRWEGCLPEAAVPTTEPQPTPTPDAEPTRAARFKFWSHLKSGDVLAIKGEFPFHSGVEAPTRMNVPDEAGRVVTYELYSVLVEYAHATEWKNRNRIDAAPQEARPLILLVPPSMLAMQCRRPDHLVLAKAIVMGFGCDSPPLNICAQPDRYGRSFLTDAPSFVIVLRVIEMKDLH